MTQIGRALGQASGASKNGGGDQVGNLERRLATVAPEWIGIAKSLWEGLTSCAQQQKLSVIEISSLEDPVCEAFHCFGAFPKETQKGLWIDFP
jgi:hypothetical protein